jgi:hypothetical protein
MRTRGVTTGTRAVDCRQLARTVEPKVATTVPDAGPSNLPWARPVSGFHTRSATSPCSTCPRARSNPSVPTSARSAASSSVNTNRTDAALPFALGSPGHRNEHHVPRWNKHAGQTARHGARGSGPGKVALPDRLSLFRSVRLNISEASSRRSQAVGQRPPGSPSALVSPATHTRNSTDL